MEIYIHMNKKKINPNCKLAIEEYVKRVSPFCKIKLMLYKDFSKLNLHNNSKIFQIIPGACTISSTDLAKLISQITLSGTSCLEFIIPEITLEKRIENESNPSMVQYDISDISFSSFESSPDVTAVYATEQLYRAFTILNNITYHK